MYFYFRKIQLMETKILLRLIKDDILHLQGITDDFSMETLPVADEVELALVRAKALLRQLELLHKSMVKTDHATSIQEVADKTPDVISQDSDPLREMVANMDTPTLVNAVIPIEDAVIPALSVDLEVPNRIQTNSSEQEISIENQIIEVEKSDFKQDPGLNIKEVTLDESSQIANDLFTQEKNESGYQSVPIRSLWDGIGINDRFLFIRELFENDSSKFEQTVNSMNQLTTIQEAVNYLKMNFKWLKSEASQKFLILVKRRFTN